MCSDGSSQQLHAVMGCGGRHDATATAVAAAVAHGIVRGAARGSASSTLVGLALPQKVKRDIPELASGRHRV